MKNRILVYKNVYLICIIVFLTVAFLVNLFSEKKYVNKTTIYITEPANNDLLNSSEMMPYVGMLGNQKTVENELEVLQSYSLIRSVFNNLDLKVTCFSTKDNILANIFLNTLLIKKTEHYDDSPIRVILDPSVPQPIHMTFKIHFLNDNEFTIESTGKKVQLYNYIDDKVVSYVPEIPFSNKRFRFGDEIRTNYFNFRVIKEDDFNKDFTEDRNLFFYFNNINDLTIEYKSAIKATPTSKNSTIIEVTLKESNPKKVTDFLNALTSAYLEKNLVKKNRIASSTVDYIDTKISDVTDSLTHAESTLWNFRTSEGGTNLNYQGQQILERLTRLEDQKATLETQKTYYESLHDYLSLNYDISNLTPPSMIEVVNPGLINLLTELISLNEQRTQLIRNNLDQQNPYPDEINAQIEQTRDDLYENINNNLSSLEISLNEVNYRIRNANSQLSEIPRAELKLQSIERKVEKTDATYAYLLQKKTEAQIARVSSMPDYEIVDPAILFMSRTVWPKTKLNYLLALLIALLLPSSYILLKDLLNNKITDTDKIEQITELPILGRIFHNFHRSRLVVNDHPNSSVTECFRSIRTNFQFFSEGGKKQIILITSTTSEEGKTFCSMNLASIFALNGQKTVLLEFDLRRPKIYQEFASNNMIGISSFLIDKAILEDIILPTQIENMDFIPAGPAAPNPAELISSGRTAELIDKLREMYDYIIIDSAPAGILAETHILMKYTDLNVLLMRINKTVKEAFQQTMKNIEANNFKNVSLIINDININRESYKYGYNRKYYSDDSNVNLLKRIFSRKRKTS